MWFNSHLSQSSGLLDKFVDKAAFQVDSGVNHGEPSLVLFCDSEDHVKNCSGIQSKQATEDDNLALRASHVLGQQGIQITNLIGCSNASKVFHAVGPQGSIAVKVMSRPRGKRAQSEFDLLSNIKHPNIIQIFAVLQGPPLCYLMEHCPGGDLFRVLHSSRKRRVKPVQLIPLSRLSIACDVASALAYIHSQSILHRDIKSANVLLGDTTDNPVAKLADFGLSTKSKECELKNSRGVGTIRWMAPDVMMGVYAVSADVYSFGILLWEILSGRLPFAKMRADKDLIWRVYNGLRPDVSECCVSTGSWEILALMERCWNEVPSSRPSMKKVHTVLRFHLDKTVDSPIQNAGKPTLDLSGGSTHVEESRISLDANHEPSESWMDLHGL